MIELHHDTPPPRLLEDRRLLDIPDGPSNPRRAWNNFSTTGKTDIHNRLIPLQSGLCIYCEQKLDKYGFHIEHILSKLLNRPLTFEYTNLSLSCIKDGSISTETTANPISCGHAPLKRANDYNETLLIKPTEAHCSELFAYHQNGEIKSNDNNSGFDRTRVEHTLKVLNLNCLRLKRERREVLDEGYGVIFDLQDDKEALKYFFNLEFEKVHNRYQSPFISTRKEHYSLWIE
ncbi:MAG: TIGR02646 family protein [Epsilonproteobacteria bacterium]|nr:MAG: TIGR02646 family protein [Campylobacterota bacterium]